ncbi:MAG: outer membrane beta-barrel protein [Bryobacteraceae bacterium]|nr:outer membrane beta-barrel protein [Bryobacteraceae bacterium]
MRSVVYAAGLCLAGMVLAQPALAQNTNNFTFHFGGGFTQPTGQASDRFDRGYNLAAGAGINFNPRVGVMAEFGYNNLNISRNALADVGVPAGDGRIYSVTLNPVVRLNPRGRFDAYLVGGGGYYRRTIEFTEPTTAAITAFDPFYGVFFPTVVPVNQVLGSFSQNKAGWNAGAGVTFAVREDSNAKFFAESRYHYIYTTPVRTAVLPVTFGFRW